MSLFVDAFLGSGLPLAPKHKLGQAQKNIPLISNDLHKFAKIFFNRRRHF
jgi:hypothetical protein